MKVYRSILIFFTAYISFTMIFLAVTYPVIGQNIASSSTRKKMTPADFKGRPDESADYLAQTTPVISLRYSSPVNCAESGKVRLKVETSVTVSDRSWIKLSKIKTPELLNGLLSHEQGHYDMGEIFSIELKKTLSTICFDKSSYKQQIDSIFKSMYTRYDSLQKQYDSETDHMRNKQAQTKWKEKIEVMLKEMQL